jgi:hypothetical protein
LFEAVVLNADYQALFTEWAFANKLPPALVIRLFCMHTWPELLAHLKQLEKLVLKHQGSKRQHLQRRIAELLARATKMRGRDLAAALKATPKAASSSGCHISRSGLAGPAARRAAESGDRKLKRGAVIRRKRMGQIVADSRRKPAVVLKGRGRPNASVSRRIRAEPIICPDG